MYLAIDQRKIIFSRTLILLQRPFWTVVWKSAYPSFTIRWLNPLIVWTQTTDRWCMLSGVIQKRLMELNG